MKVYLAGSIRSGWQDRVKDKIKNVVFYDPSKKEIDDTWGLQKYGSWDLAHIRRCDVVFGYMEKTNPSGIGMSCEMAYAYGLGKTVILCLEPENEHQKNKYLDFMQIVSHITFTDFDLAISYLKSFL